MATILSVDDSMVIRNMMKSILGKEGHEIIIAANGADAMAVASEKSVDLVLADINMPDMNGISLLSKLRRLDSYAEVPIIMVTTENDDYKKNKARSLGATGWLSKPFSPDRLINAVNNLLG